MFQRHNRRVTSVLIPASEPRRVLLPEAIADASHRLYSRHGQPSRRELCPKPGHVHVHGARLHEAVFAPDQIQQLLAPEDAARCAHEGGQQIELLWREIHPLALHDDLEAVPGDLEVARLEALLPVRDIAPLASPDHRADPDRKSTRLNSSHRTISYAVFCLKKK